jgi:hypothetical protein
MTTEIMNVIRLGGVSRNIVLSPVQSPSLGRAILALLLRPEKTKYVDAPYFSCQVDLSRSTFSVIALMDHPYRGELGLSPDAFELIYHQVMGQ